MKTQQTLGVFLAVLAVVCFSAVASAAEPLKADLSSAAEKSAADESPWSLHGTVRDEDGSPVLDATITVDASFSGLFDSLSTKSDAEGRFSLPITPLRAFSGVAVDETTGLPAVGFRFQQLVLSVGWSRYDANERKVYALREKSRSQSGDLIVVGDFTTPEDVAALKDRLAGEDFEVLFVMKNEPAEIDFVLEPKSDDDARLSLFHGANYWPGKPEADRRYEIFRKTVFPYTMNEAFAAGMELSDKVSASLRFPKSEIMVGEPTKFDYVVRNDSDVDLYITVGGDYRGSGRPTTFTMQAVRTDGDEEEIVSEIPLMWDFGGGFINEETIPARGGEYLFDLCLPCWLKLEEPGEYRIDVARRLGPSPLGRRSEEGVSERRLTTPSLYRVASATLTVTPRDPDAFGKLIDAWGEEATAEDANYDKRQKNLDMLAHVEDERVIPWLIKLTERSDFHYTASVLAKFNDDRALEVIGRGLLSNDKAKSHTAAVFLSRSVHPGAIGILWNHQEHWNDSVRLTVVQAAKKMPKDGSLRMLRKRFDDSGCEGAVGREARRIYKEIRGDDTVDRRKEFEESLQADRKRYENMTPPELLDEILENRAAPLVAAEKAALPTDLHTAALLGYQLLLLKAAGKIEAAEEALKEYVALHDRRRDDPHVRTIGSYPYGSIAAANVELGHYDEARELVLKVEGFWDKARALAELGKRIGKAGEKERAANVFDEATAYSMRVNDADDPHRQRNSNFPKSWPLMEIAEGWAKMGRFEKALETARLIDDPAIDDPYYVGRSLRTIARLQRRASLESEAEKTLQIPMIPLERAQALLELAHEKIEAEDFESARAFLDEVEGLLPTIEREDLRSDVVRALAVNNARIGRTDKAKNLFAELYEALSESEKHPSADDTGFGSKRLGHLIGSQIAAGFFDESLETVRAFPGGEHRDRGLQWIAEGYARNDKDREAMGLIEEIQSHGGRQEGLHMVAKVQIEQGRLDAALETILKMRPDDDRDFGHSGWTLAEMSLQGVCLGLLAEAHAKAGRHGEALALANRVVDTAKRLHAYRLIAETLADGIVD